MYIVLRVLAMSMLLSGIKPVTGRFANESVRQRMKSQFANAAKLQHRPYHGFRRHLNG